MLLFQNHIDLIILNLTKILCWGDKMTFVDSSPLIKNVA